MSLCAFWIDIRDCNLREAKDDKLSFTCFLNKNPFGKTYRCVVTHQNYSKPLEADFRELTEEDFRIRGIIVLKADIERSDLTIQSVILKRQENLTFILSQTKMSEWIIRLLKKFVSIMAKQLL